MSVCDFFRDLFKKSEETMNGQGDRVRTWLVVSATDKNTLRGYYGRIRKLDRGDDVVIIRGDIAETADGASKLVVPVDVDRNAYAMLIQDIETIVGAQNLEVLEVKVFDPPIPQNASGFITQEELGETEKVVPFKDQLEPGRQDFNSPGYNPWG